MFKKRDGMLSLWTVRTKETEDIRKVFLENRKRKRETETVLGIGSSNCRTDPFGACVI